MARHKIAQNYQPQWAMKRREPAFGWRLFCAACSAGIIATAPARAAAWGEALAMEPLAWNWDGIDISLGGSASGAAYAAHAQGGPLRGTFNDNGVTGQLRANARVERTLDDGLVLGARANLLLAHDVLSDDRYGDDIFQKVYVYMQAGYGTVQIGQQHGVGAQLGMTGPRLAARVSLDDPDTTFFVNPATDQRFDRLFRPYAAQAASSNDAKINYTTPRLFGLQIGGSYTPSQTKEALPFISNPPDGPNSQKSILEGAVSYSTYLSDVALGFSASVAQGHLQHPTAGHDDLLDWAIGAQAAYTISDTRISLGGGYRESNAYAFHTAQVFSNGNTRLTHVALLAQNDPWSVGGEYSTARISGPTAAASFTMNAYQAAVGYHVNNNMDVVLGWQWYDYSRSVGVFYNGRNGITMNAGFLTLNYEL